MKLKGRVLLALLLAFVLTLAIGAAAFAADTESATAETLPSDGTADPAEPADPGLDGDPDNTGGTEDTGDPGMDGGTEDTDDTAPKVTLSFYDYGGTEPMKTVTHTLGAAIKADEVPVSEYLKGGAVQHWIMVCGNKTDEIDDITSVTPTEDTRFYAAWKVSYLDTDGKTSLGSELVKLNGKPVKVPEKTSGRTIGGWLDGNNKNANSEPAKTEITGDVTYTAWLRPTLNTSSTVSYVKGYTDSNENVYQFGPTRSLTRGEAAQMVYNLLSSTALGPADTSFSDVSSGKWYAPSIKTLASNGILTGTGGGKFEPTREISRAEFVVMVSRLVELDAPKENHFSDSLYSWCYNEVNAFYEKGWITGYKEADGTQKFLPQKKITRAEAVTILNRVLGRSTDATRATISKLDVRLFIDVDNSNYWAFYDIMDAATGGGTNLPSSGLSEGRHRIGSSYYYVNASGQFVMKSAGVQQMPDGKYYYFKKEGSAAPAYSSSVRSLGGKLYLIDSDGSIIHEPRSCFDNRVHEYADHLYYIKTDGSLLCNGYWGELYFGSSGAYTSDNQELDAWVFDFAKDIFRNTDSQEGKLLSVYERLRDYPKEKLGSGSLGYTRRNLNGYDSAGLALLFFKTAQGSCEEWSSAMVYAARRVGYQATKWSGSLRNNARHAWEVIEIRGTDYTFDVEQEWGYMYGHYGSYRQCDCFMMEYAPDEYISYGDRFGNPTTNIWSPYHYEY